jgi:uncharacterized membrane protein YgdD (TMEM256/DUF423 family)
MTLSFKLKNNSHMERLFFMIGSLSGFLGVALGAFAAHALKGRADAVMLASFEVGVRYQMYHSFALLAVGLAHTRWPGAVLTASGWLFVIGTVLFSGSLYALSITGAPWLVAFTPIGGCALLAGWLCLAWAVFRPLGKMKNERGEQ